MTQGLPQTPGYYWAKWQIAADGTVEGDELTPASEWEIVQVNDNINGWQDLTDEEEPERLSVSVAGVQQTQWRDCFVWGVKVAELNAPVKQPPKQNHPQGDPRMTSATLNYCRATDNRPFTLNDAVAIRELFALEVTPELEVLVQALQNLAGIPDRGKGFGPLYIRQALEIIHNDGLRFTFRAALTNALD